MSFRLRTIVLVGILLAIAASTVAVAAPIDGTITPADATHLDAVVDNGVASTCGSSKAFPGTHGLSDSVHYDARTFTNSSGHGECINVTLSVAGATVGGFSSAHLDAFDPAALASGYIGDVGSRIRSGEMRSYSVSVPASRSYSVVVEEFQSEDSVPSYTLQVAPATPTGVTFSSMSAVRMNGVTRIRWRTASETRLVGFFLYRQRGGVRLRLNATLIPARASGRPRGVGYAYVDRTRASKGDRYWVRGVLRAGGYVSYGPVVVGG
jgi:hypothetical protein